MNPYDPPEQTQPINPPGAQAYSWAKVLWSLIGLFFMLAPILFASINVYFSVNPSALQSGTQVKRAEFGLAQLPELILWVVILLAMVLVFMRLARLTWRLMLR